MKTDDLNLGQKVKILNFLILYDKSMSKCFLYIWKVVLKLKEDGKNEENQEKKTSKNFLLTHFYLEGWNSTIKSCLFNAKFFEFEEFF